MEQCAIAGDHYGVGPYLASQPLGGGDDRLGIV